MAAFATKQDLITLWRAITPEEEERAEALLPLVSDLLRAEGQKVGKDLDEMVLESAVMASVAKSVTVDIVARTLMTSTNREPTSQFSEAALGYSVSGTFLNPGGGVFIKKSELSRLGFLRQRIGGIEFYD